MPNLRQVSKDYYDAIFANMPEGVFNVDSYMIRQIFHILEPRTREEALKQAKRQYDSIIFSEVE